MGEKEEAENWCAERSNGKCSQGAGAGNCVLEGIPTRCGRTVWFKKVTQELKDKAAQESGNGVNIPSIEIDIPTIDVPTISVPGVNVPTINVPGFNTPSNQDVSTGNPSNEEDADSESRPETEDDDENKFDKILGQAEDLV